MERKAAVEVVRRLYESWYPCAVRIAHVTTGSIEAAEDAVQESFQALYPELLGETVEDQSTAGAYCSSWLKRASWMSTRQLNSC